MDEAKGDEVASVRNSTEIERTSERELVVTRTVNGPARIVFQAWGWTE
ncbi:hypothetical protein [Asticcacaulis sp. AC466]|nr:hypothetical protein [Asticcacaulis sp. AC466]